MSWDTVAGTGHRPQHLLPPQRTWLRSRLPDAVAYLVERRGMRVGISGLALGFDTWWAQALLARRASHGDVELWGYAPCPQQPNRWTRTDRQVWESLIKQADRVRYVAEWYHETCMDDRNEAMLDDADAVIAGWRALKRSGGTFKAVRSAADRRLPGILLDIDHERTRLVEFPPTLDVAA